MLYIKIKENITHTYYLHLNKKLFIFLLKKERPIKEM